jgi:uncharacterized membrane protein YtjA (UPF0391 family)
MMRLSALLRAEAAMGGDVISGGFAMLSWAIGFLIIAIIAAVLGFGGIAGAAAGIAKILFIIFLVLFVIALITGGIRRRR